MAKDELDDATIRVMIKAMKVKKYLDDLEDRIEITQSEIENFRRILKKEGKGFAKATKNELSAIKDSFLNFLMP